MIKIIVNTSVNGTHSWPGGVPAILQSEHRHRFTVKAEIETHHADRELEIITVQDKIDQYFSTNFTKTVTGYKFGHRSCETIAEELAEQLAVTWPGRAISVEVLEDGELGGRVDRAVSSIDEHKLNIAKLMVGMGFSASYDQESDTWEFKGAIGDAEKS